MKIVSCSSCHKDYILNSPALSSWGGTEPELGEGGVK